MLPSNIEQQVSKILQRNNGWIRKEQCAKQYARDSLTGKIDGTKRTRFYRWAKQIEKGKVKDFQIIKFPGNISYIGFKSSDPKVLDSLISENKKLADSVKSGFGFFEWLRDRSDKAEFNKKMRSHHNALEMIRIQQNHLEDVKGNRKAEGIVRRQIETLKEKYLKP